MKDNRLSPLRIAIIKADAKAHSARDPNASYGAGSANLVVVLCEEIERISRKLTPTVPQQG
jgi:hypothetical protein